MRWRQTIVLMGGITFVGVIAWAAPVPPTSPVRVLLPDDEDVISLIPIPPLLNTIALGVDVEQEKQLEKFLRPPGLFPPEVSPSTSTVTPSVDPSD
jgi:hypothetical protein